MGVFCPPLIPFLSLIKSRVRRPGPDSESAQPDSESVSPSLGLTWGSSHGSESASGRVGSFAGAAFLPSNVSASWPWGEMLFTTTRGQGHRAIARRGLVGRGYRHPAVSRRGPPCGVGSTPAVGRRSASQSTRAVGSSRSRQR